MRRKALAEPLRQRSHRREVGDAAMIDPMPQLARSKRFGAEVRHLGGE
jgi:hypothetical protein